MSASFGSPLLSFPSAATRIAFFPPESLRSNGTLPNEIGAGLHAAQIHSQFRFGGSHVEAGLNVDRGKRRFGLAGRQLSLEIARGFREPWTGSRPESSCRRSTFPLHRMLLAAEEIGHQILAEADFVGGEPCGRRPADDAWSAYCDVRNPGCSGEVPINLLESHLVELSFVLLERSFHPRTN